MSEFRALLRRHVSVSDSEAALLEAHYERMALWNARTNLTSLTKLEDVVTQHYAESIALARLLSPGTVLDAGSGAGFPGFPLAVVRPDCQVTLVESDLKKAVFLSEAVSGLRNAIVARKRLSEMTGRFDWVVSRAVAWREIASDAARLGRRVALLTSGEKAVEIKRSREFSWDSITPVTASSSRVVLLGTSAILGQLPLG